MTECVCFVWIATRAAQKVLMSERRGGSLHLVGFLLCSCPHNVGPLPICVSVSLWGDRAAGSVGGDQVLVVVVSASLRGWTVLAVLCVLAVSSRPAPFLFWGGVKSQIYHCGSCRGHRSGSSSSPCDSRHAHGTAASRFACDASAAVSWWVTVCFRNACRGKARLRSVREPENHSSREECGKERKKRRKEKQAKFNCQLTYIDKGILWRVAAFSFPFLLLLIPDGSPGTISQVLDLLDIFTRLFQYLREQPGKENCWSEWAQRNLITQHKFEIKLWGPGGHPSSQTYIARQSHKHINISNWWKRLMICLSFLKTGLNLRATILSFFKSTNSINEIKWANMPWMLVQRTTWQQEWNYKPEINTLSRSSGHSGEFFAQWKHGGLNHSSTRSSNLFKKTTNWRSQGRL